MTTSESDRLVGEASKPTPDDIQADIEQTRAELGETVEALTAKLDVKSRAKAKIGEAKEHVVATVDEANKQAADLSERARVAATDEDGNPTAAASAGLTALIVTAVAVISILIWRRST